MAATPPTPLSPTPPPPTTTAATAAAAATTITTTATAAETTSTTTTQARQTTQTTQTTTMLSSGTAIQQRIYTIYSSVRSRCMEFFQSVMKFFRNIEFKAVPAPEMRRKNTVRYLQQFTAKSRQGMSLWLIPRKLSCGLLWIGVFVLIVGIITTIMSRHDSSSQSMKFSARTTFHMLRTIGIGFIAGGTSLLALAAFSFFHASCVRYYEVKDPSGTNTPCEEQSSKTGTRDAMETDDDGENSHPLNNHRQKPCVCKTEGAATIMPLTPRRQSTVMTFSPPTRVSTCTMPSPGGFTFYDNLQTSGSRTLVTGPVHDDYIDMDSDDSVEFECHSRIPDN